MLAIFNRQDIRYQCRFLDSLFKLNVNQATSGNMDFPDFTLISFMICADLPPQWPSSLVRYDGQFTQSVYTGLKTSLGVCHFQQC